MDFKDGVTRAAQSMEKTVTQAFGTMGREEQKFQKDMEAGEKAMGRFRDASGKLREANGRFVGDGAAGIKDLDKGIEGLIGHTDSLRHHILEVGKVMGIAFGLEQIRELGMGILEKTAEFQGFTNRIAFASKDANDSVKNLNFLKQAIVDLHLPIQQTYDGFSQMEAGLKGFVEGDNLRGLSKGVLTAAAALHLGDAEMQRTLYDFKEIGERGLSARYENSLAGNLPGVNDVVRKAFGKTMHQLQEEGMSGTEFLSKMGPALENYFKGGLENYSHSLQASMVDTANAAYLKQVEIGEKLENVYKDIMKHIRDLIYWAGDAFLGTIGFIKEHQTALKALGAAVVALGAWYVTYIGLMKTYNMWLGIVTIAEKAYVGWLYLQEGASIQAALAMAGLNTAMLANPAVWLAGAFVALGVAVYEVYQHWDELKKSLNDFDWDKFAMDRPLDSLTTMDRLVNSLIDDLRILAYTFKQMWDSAKGDWTAAAQDIDMIIKAQADQYTMLHVMGKGKKNRQAEEARSNKGYNSAAGGAETHEKKEGTSHRNVTVTIMKLVGIEHVHVGSVAEASAIAADKVTTSMIGAVRDFETGVAVAM